jgi:outer membrane receptor protein involved in Fe transport
MSPRYGDFNRGASIDFITRDGITRPSIFIGAGSFGSVKGAATYGNYDAARSRPSFFASLDFNHIDGYAQRQRLDHARGFARMHIPVGNGDVSVSAHAFDSDWEAPSYLDKALVKAGTLSETAFINPTDGGDLTNKLAYARYRRGLTPGQEFMAMGYVSRREWLRFRHDQLISAAQTQVKQVDNRTTWGFRAEKTFAPTLFGRPSQFMIGSHLQRDDAETLQDRTKLRALIDNIDNVDEFLTQFAVYAQEQIGITDRLKLLLGLRYSSVDIELQDNIRPPGTYVAAYDTNQWSPKVGIAATPIRNLDVFVNLATGMRSPTPRTEVRNSIGSVSRVEIAETRSYEAGVRARAFRRLDIQGSVWRADNSNEIRGIPPGGTQFESLGKSRRDGGEFDLRLSIGDTRLYGGLSWVSAELLTPATPGAIYFPDVPDYVHQVGFETAVPVGAGGSSRLTVLADLAFHGPKNLNTTGTIRSDTYQRATGRVTYYHKTRYRAFLGAVLYPGSRYGESEFLFGGRAGVRTNPELTIESGLTLTF